MKTYSQIHADYQRTAAIHQVITNKLEKKWYKANHSEIGPEDVPDLILIYKNIIMIRYFCGYFKTFDNTFKEIWHSGTNKSFCPVINDGKIYLINGGRLDVVDLLGKKIIDNVLISGATSENIFPFLVPFPQQFFISQYTHIGRISSPPKQNEPKIESTLIFFSQLNSEIWVKTWKQKTLPSVPTHDLKKGILCFQKRNDTDLNRILIYELETGNEIAWIDLKKNFPLSASLDSDDNIHLLTSSKDLLLSVYSLDGKKMRSVVLPNLAGREPHQPPAIGLNGREYVIVSDTLVAIDNDTVSWTEPLYPSYQKQHVTVLGDNSVVVTSGLAVFIINPDGKQRQAIYLAPEEEATTPAVVDNDGNLYFGSTKGVYCYK